MPDLRVAINEYDYQCLLRCCSRAQVVMDDQAEHVKSAFDDKNHHYE